MADLRPHFNNEQERAAYLEDMEHLAGYINKRVQVLYPKVDPINIYDLRREHPDFEYYILISGRGRAKSDNVIEYNMAQALAYGKEIAFVRRRMESYESGRGKTIIADLLNKDVTPDGRNFVEWATQGAANGIMYRSAGWWLTYTDPDTGKIIKDDSPIMYACAISTGDDTAKGMQIPKADYIILDEITKRQKGNLWPYLPGEEIDYFNLQKTIFRGRPSANSVWMLGNTVNKTCPILQQMGLRHFGATRQGDLQEYTSRTEEGETRILFYNLPPAHIPATATKTADRFFCFDSPEVRQITAGEWEVHEYPSISRKEGHGPDREKYIFFMEYNGERVQGKVCYGKGTKPYIYFNPWTSEIPEDAQKKALIYSDKLCLRPNWRRLIYRPQSELEKGILQIMENREVYYSSNFVGEAVAAFLAWSKNQ